VKPYPVQKSDHLDLMRETAKEFPAIEHRSQIRTLRVWHCKYKSLRAVGDFQNLEELVIATFPDSTLDVLGPLVNLRYLSILHLPKITDIEALSSFGRLETLSLQTSPSWDASGKCTVVASLEPIARMPGLKHLELFGVCPPNKSLAAVEELKTLKSARFSQYPSAEIERFYRLTSVSNQYNPEPSFDNAT
jgi:hypothetical protein